MTLLVAQQIDLDGLQATYAAVTASDTIANVGIGGAKILHVKNGGGSTDTVTIVIPGTYLGVAIPDITAAVPAGEDRFILVPTQAIASGSGLVTVQHGFTTSVTAALLQA